MNVVAVLRENLAAHISEAAHPIFET